MRNLIILVAVMVAFANTALSQTTEFSYQGSLKDGATVANGNYDFEFRLFDASSGGSQIGSTVVSRPNVAVTNGIFSVALDFGSPGIPNFPGADRYLEVRVKTTSSSTYTTLAPRQKVSSSPYALQSATASTANSAATAANATTANNALQLGGIAADQFVVTTDPRMTNARPPTAGSGNYIQNTTVPQSTSNFNVSGTGTANLFNSLTNYNIQGLRVLSAVGINNMFVGINAGASNTTGSSNTFVGRAAGEGNTTGNGNAFFGVDAGRSNTAGVGNTFFGRSAGQANVTTGGNSFFGSRSGEASVGVDNSFFGAGSGIANTDGNYNSFFGKDTGRSITTGSNNSFFGFSAGLVTTGNANSFFGVSAGVSNTTGSLNTIVGTGADVGSGGLSFATAIGASAVVNSSNRIQLGRQDGSDDVRVSGNLLLVTLAGAGSTALCRNVFQQVGTCSSSLRYKTNVDRFRPGLDLINQLKPITFDWREGGMRDLGLGAEDVAAIEPLLVTYNTKGEVEGVKYDRIGVVLVNAVKEQQQMIERQQKQIEELLKANTKLNGRLRAVERRLAAKP